ncbi:hypothetical protein FO519_004022 [Halicephalobus sp. NKZ332]|nr:hypothetical protein FO519_004022 [Halicephalobus sp. NKZ332]
MSQSKRLATSTADLSYDEYVQRRDREVTKNRPSSKKSVRSASSGGRPGSKSSNSSSKNGSQPTGQKPYEFEGNEYRRNGYETFNSQLGEDPMTALRTLKNRLRTMNVSSSAKDRTVKAHLCKQACDKLATAEDEMQNLAHVRSQAILQGDTKKATEVSKQMHDLRDRATFTAYTDLLLDENQINPFGINSKWVPDPEHSEPEEQEEKPKKKKPPEFKPIRSMSARKRDREKDEKKDNKLALRPLTPNKPTKRNERMFGNNSVDPVTGQVRGLAPGEDDPYSLPSELGMCPYCEEQNYDFSRTSLLKRHMKEACPCLTTCDYCDKVIEVSTLNDHQLNRCQFVEDSLGPCNLCGLACYKGEASHPRCRKMAPPEGAEWCPLCSIAVKPKDSKEAWSKHLKKDCYNNPRKEMSGIPDPDWGLVISISGSNLT